MALAAVKISIGTSLADGSYAPSVSSASIPDIATVVANTATLVADGASPTQAHVTTLNTGVAALNTALSGDVVVMWSGSVITTRNQLRAALKAALRAIEGGNGGLAE